MATKDQKNKKSKLLLHICCGPCASYVVKRLQEKFEVIGFYYNPNIHPEEEYLARKNAALQLSEIFNFPLILPPWDPADYFSSLSLKEDPSTIIEKAEQGDLYIEKQKRCPVCYQVRLLKTAQQARKMHIDYFSTTLLISPYQDLELIKKIGENIGKIEKVNFYFQDFREGFWDSKKISKELGLYRQKYCGCIFSKQEALKIKKEKKEKKEESQ